MAPPGEGDSMAPAAQPAVAYHDADFTWESLRDAVQPLLAQRAAAAAVAAAPEASRSRAASSAAGGASDCATAADGAAQDADTTEDGSWEAFHRQHSSAQFFRPKRYLVCEFPQLASRGVRILDIGAGNGASILPVLAANSTASATCCDVSATALRLLAKAAEEAGVERDRVRTVVLDAADPASSSPPPLERAGADLALLVFALSAVPPSRMVAVLRLAHDSLAPGGLLLFRDYALYDLPMLRFPDKQRLAVNLYRRDDGILAYFFTTEDLASRMGEAGFARVECTYACVNNRNRKTGEVLQRAFVHGVFRKVDEQCRGMPEMQVTFSNVDLEGSDTSGC